VATIKGCYYRCSNHNQASVSRDAWEQISRGNNTHANTLEPWNGPELTGIEGIRDAINAAIAITLAGEVHRADI